MNVDELRNLDFGNAGGWSAPIKIGFCLILVILIGVGGWWFFIREQQEQLQRVRAQEPGLKRQFAEKQAKVVNLDAYREQLDEMRVILREMMRQLPSKTEMPDLIVDISQTALASGIENELFEPRAESVKDFYAEQPIQLRMVGTYHQFGTFVSGVATLPRVVILTMHDIQLRPRAGTAARGRATTPAPSGALVLEGTIKTYRYLEEGEGAEEPAPPPQPQRGRGRRG
ncbi:MAG TPA: type 4a pilus biogenesis protein PilO [Xanthomonadaceae bacterium]|nr:type 4a pilus biogenesis protein PilO [Xanthomonadaceae bacterium]